MQELARSTLIHALQTERNCVFELEAQLSTLQSNNSAIADMVQSRDSLINELNDRVGVFEEDKLVLKAALRQLQKEMKEEAPKTQKLISTLKASKELNEKLNSDIKKLNTQHTTKLGSLKNEIQKKEKYINETDVRMAQITVYIDQLEERLATFALARRELTEKEEQCVELEEQLEAMEQTCTSLQKQLVEINEEKAELKSVMECMVQERTKLKKSIGSYVVANVTLANHTDSLRKLVEEKNDEIQRLEQVVIKNLKDCLLERGEQINELLVKQSETHFQMVEKTKVITNLNQDLLIKNSILNDLNSETSTLKEQLNIKGSVATDLGNENAILKDQLKDLKIAIDALEEEVKLNKELLSNATEEIKLLNSPPSTLEEEETIFSVEEVESTISSGEESDDNPELEIDEESKDIADSIEDECDTELSEEGESPSAPISSSTMSTDDTDVELLTPPPPPPPPPPLESLDINNNDVEFNIINDVEKEKESNETLNAWSKENDEESENDELVEKQDYSDSSEDEDLIDSEDEIEEEEECSENKADLVDPENNSDINKSEPDLPELFSSVDKVNTGNKGEVKDPKTNTNERPKQLPPPPFRSPPRRNIPLRGIRKSISKLTGVHGFFTPPSSAFLRRVGPMKPPLPRPSPPSPLSAQKSE